MCCVTMKDHIVLFTIFFCVYSQLNSVKSSLLVDDFVGCTLLIVTLHDLGVDHPVLDLAGLGGQTYGGVYRPCRGLGRLGRLMKIGFQGQSAGERCHLALNIGCNQIVGDLQDPIDGGT